MPGIQTRIKPMVSQQRSHMVSGFNDAQVLDVSLHKKKKKSVRDKVTGKKWIYLETHSINPTSVISKGESDPKIWSG